LKCEKKNRKKSFSQDGDFLNFATPAQAVPMARQPRSWAPSTGRLSSRQRPIPKKSTGAAVPITFNLTLSVLI
jgi:hypothetical protein